MNKELDVKKKLTVIIILTLTAAGLYARETGKSDYYKLSFSTLITNEKAPVESMIEKTAADDYFSLGILYTNLIIISDRMSSLDDAVENLAAAEAEFTGDPLFSIYKGITEAFLARRLTIFGVENLKNTERFMTSVPVDHPDWYIRLLRGISYYRLGQGLPGIWPIKEYKDKASEVGKEDLMYVLQQHDRSSVHDFRAADYDWELMPVPDIAADLALDLIL